MIQWPIIIWISSERLSKSLWEKRFGNSCKEGLGKAKEAWWSVKGRWQRKKYQGLAWSRRLICITVWWYVISFSKQVICCCCLCCLTRWKRSKQAQKNAPLSFTCRCYICWCGCGFSPFFVPISLSESESVATLILDFCLRKSSSLSLPFADSKKEK